MLPKVLSLISIVLLLAWMFYFMVGCLPLLILKHDDESDSRLVRGMFAVHYLVLMCIAAVGALSCALAGRPTLAAVIAFIALYGLLARQMIVPRMDQLRDARITTDAPTKVKFKRLHITGLTLNIVLLGGFVSFLSLLSAEIATCVETPPGCRGDSCRVQCSLL